MQTIIHPRKKNKSETIRDMEVSDDKPLFFEVDEFESIKSLAYKLASKEKFKVRVVIDEVPIPDNKDGKTEKKTCVYKIA